ncbi:MAG: peptidylprolyl isomerase [Bacteroidales bacterium]
MKFQLPSRSRLSLFALALVVAVTPLRAEIVERVLVKVNGEIFTKTELEARQVAAIRSQNPQASDADLKKQVEAVTPQILVDAIDEMLLLQRGKELGYKMTDDQFNEILNRLKTENKITTEEQFQAALKQEGMTLLDLRRQIERRMIIERVQNNEVFSKLSITDTEARKYYEEHKNEFTTTPTVTLREILVKVPADDKGVNVGLEEEAKQKAEAIRQRALKGESFEKLAELSDAPSKSNGGLVGPVKRSELNPQFAALLEKMKVGEVSEPIRTATGFDIVKLEAATETRVLPFEEARNDIAQKVYAGKQQAEFDSYLKRLRASAIIEWKVPELQKLYDEQVARGRSGQPSGASE